jgi:hypothetical protein
MKLSTSLLAAALLIAVPASAQSLGELAKREQERKKATPNAKKTYTNDDLKQVAPPTGTPGKPADDAAKGDAKADDAKAEPTKVPPTDDKKPGEPAKDEAYWRARITGAREDIRRNEAFKDALQSRINGLTADFSARDDPYQRAKVADDRQKALAELARVTEDIEKTKKLIVEIEDEARRAGVPPGWLR